MATETLNDAFKDQITKAQKNLTLARVNGDKLKIALAEAALNDLLDRIKL